MTAGLVIIIVLLCVGLGGMLWQYQALTAQSKAQASLFDQFENNASVNIFIIGKVASISGRDVVVQGSKGPLNVYVAADASLFAVNFSGAAGGAVPPQRTAVLTDIKVGQTVSVNAKLIDTQLVGSQILIYP